MNYNYSLKSIFKRFKVKISITFLLLVFENISKILQPLVLGIAINDLINNSNKGLLWFCGLYLLSFTIGVIRRYYDTRAYTHIYTTVSSEIVEIQNDKNISTSSISARSGLIKELVDFFEYDIPQAFASAISVVGALIMIALFSWWIFGAALLTIIIIILIYRFSRDTIYKYNIGINNELEHRVQVLERKNQSNILQHFRNISNWLVKLSDLETLNFGLIEITLFILAIFTLYTSATELNADTGSIFSTIMYILEFSNGIYMLPILFQQLIRLKEISTRLESI